MVLTLQGHSKHLLCGRTDDYWAREREEERKMRYEERQRERDRERERDRRKDASSSKAAPVAKVRAASRSPARNLMP